MTGRGLANGGRNGGFMTLRWRWRWRCCCFFMLLRRKS
jgi:hypothetical protein